MIPRNFLPLPDIEFGIIWRYLDGVSQALARRFEGGSPPGEENLTFLLCELLDEGTTGLHLLEYPLRNAKEDLARADGGFTLDVSFQTHEHSRSVEHRFSGADLGIIFTAEYPLIGHFERAILLQAKRLFPASGSTFTLNASFKNFHVAQRDLLIEVGKRFSAEQSIFYLWYVPSSTAFSDNDAKAIRSLEASATAYLPFANAGYPLIDNSNDDRQRAWRTAQPGTRFTSLPIVAELTPHGQGPRLISLYEARSRFKPWDRRRPDFGVFEPFANLLLFGLHPGGVGNDASEWVRLARGEKVTMPSLDAQTKSKRASSEVPETAPTPRHSIKFSLRTTLEWPPDVRH